MNYTSNYNFNLPEDEDFADIADLTNNWAETDSILAGKSDLSNLGTVETATATYPHTVGEYFVDANGQFVKCTAAIAVGDTIAVGTNVSIIGVAQVLSELNSNIDVLNGSKIEYFALSNAAPSRTFSYETMLFLVVACTDGSYTEIFVFGVSGVPYPVEIAKSDTKHTITYNNDNTVTVTKSDGRSSKGFVIHD